MLSASAPSAASLQTSANGSSTTVLNNAVVQSAELNPGSPETDATAKLFSGELNAAMVNAESAITDATREEFSAEVTGEDSSAQSQHEDDGDQQPPTAEQWLQAMLDQQQLQLQTYDAINLGAVNLNGALPVQDSPLNNPGNPNSARNNSVINHLESDRLNSLKVLTPQGFLSQPYSVSNTQLHALPTEQDFRGDETRATDTANTLAAVNATALSTSTTLVPPVPGDVAAGEGTLSSPLLTASAAEPGSRAPASLNLHAPEAKWGEQLLHALRDNVQVQIQQKIQSATIRLDPPELGSLEIFLSHESGRLQVQITASQADVARLIQSTSDRLRHELSGPQFTQVDVRTSGESQGGQQQSRDRRGFTGDETILANHQELVADAKQSSRTGDVLVTV